MNKQISKRLSDIIGKDVKNIAKLLNCSQRAINQFKQGITVPRVDKLIKIAEFYGVSVDYLLGLNDVKSTDTNIKSICDYTGLSEAAINNLHNSTQINRALCEEIISVICKK